MLNSILGFVSLPFKAFAVYVFRVCFKDELIRLDRLQKRIHDYESRLRQANKEAADRETLIKKLSDRVAAQQEELERLENGFRQHGTRKLENIMEMLDEALEECVCETESKIAA